MYTTLNIVKTDCGSHRSLSLTFGRVVVFRYYALRHALHNDDFWRIQDGRDQREGSKN